MEDTKTTARVQITLDIPVPDNWNPDCTMAQINKQARESAISLLRYASHDSVPARSKLSELLDSGKAVIVGVPCVTMVLVNVRSR